MGRGAMNRKSLRGRLGNRGLEHEISEGKGFAKGTMDTKPLREGLGNRDHAHEICEGKGLGKRDHEQGNL